MQKLLIIFLSATIIGCQGTKKPSDVLSQTQLSALLVDIYIAEARADNIPGSKDSTIRYFIPFEQKLLKNKGLSDTVLRKTYAYYLGHPKELEQVYDAVIDTLSLREQRVRRLQEPNVIKKDSTLKAKAQ